MRLQEIRTLLYKLTKTQAWGEQGGPEGRSKGDQAPGTCGLPAPTYQYAGVAQTTEPGDQLLPGPDVVHTQPLSDDHLHVQEGDPHQQQEEEVHQQKAACGGGGGLAQAAGSPWPLPLLPGGLDPFLNLAAQALASPPPFWWHR